MLFFHSPSLPSLTHPPSLTLAHSFPPSPTPCIPASRCGQIYPYDDPLWAVATELEHLQELVISNGNDQESRKYFYRYCFSRGIFEDVQMERPDVAVSDRIDECLFDDEEDEDEEEDDYDEEDD